MPFGLNFRSGQYNLSKKNSRLLRIYLLDNTVIDWPLSNRATGLDCIQHIEAKLNFNEAKYFGLKYLPKTSKSNPGKNPTSPRWVNLTKPLKQQLSNLDDFSVYLRIMYYVANISVFNHGLTRFHYYLQIRNDVIDGCITVGNDEATTLASLAVQAEVGDYDKNVHTVEFFREFYLFPEALVQDQDETKHQGNIDQLIVKTLQKYKGLAGIADHEAEHKYVEYCLQLQGYGEEVLPANIDEEACYIGSSCYGIIVLSSEKSSYKWENVLAIAAHRSSLNFKIVTDNYTHNLQYSMEDSEFTKYAAKLLCNRKTFYDKNPDATNRNMERNGVEAIPQLVRRPTLRKGQEIVIVGENHHSRSDSPRHDSSQSLESAPDYRHPPDYHESARQRNNLAQRQTASFRHRQRPHSMIGPRGYVKHNDITISSPNLINISQSELCLDYRKNQQGYLSNPDVYNKIVGINGCGGGLPTYEEHLILNGSKSSLHQSHEGSNNRIHRIYPQAGISRSKQSLLGQSNEIFQGRPVNQQSHERASPTHHDDYYSSRDYYQIINNNLLEIPKYEYFEQQNTQDISHETQMSSMSHATMVVLPDSTFQTDHQKVVQDLVDSGLKTLNPKNLLKSSKDMICTENIFDGFVRDLSGGVVMKSNKISSEHIPSEQNHEKDGEEDLTELEMTSRIQRITAQINSGQYISEYNSLNELGENGEIEAENEFRITVGSHNHDFYNLESPKTSVDVLYFWRDIWKMSQKSLVIIQLENVQINYFDDESFKSEFSLSQTKKREDSSYIFHQYKLIKNVKDNEKVKKMRIYHLQLKEWFSASGRPLESSRSRFSQSEEFLESILVERKYSHPIALVSNDKYTFSGVFILARIMLHTTRHGDSEIDASQVLRELRRFNPKFVITAEQYIFSYELLMDFLQNQRLI